MKCDTAGTAFHAELLVNVLLTNETNGWIYPIYPAVVKPICLILLGNQASSS